jgi:hypothetical protein
MTPAPQQAIILITGIQAAGKSTIAQILAERLPRSVHVRGDLFRRMVINGRADMTPDPSAEAVRQLRLRYRLTAAACDEYFREGFTVVAQDVILGGHLTEMAQLIQHRPLLGTASARPAGQLPDEHRDVGAVRRGQVDVLPLADLQVLGQPAGIRVDRPGRATEVGPDLQPPARQLVPAQHRPLLRELDDRHGPSFQLPARP